MDLKYIVLNTHTNVLSSWTLQYNEEADVKQKLYKLTYNYNLC